MFFFPPSFTTISTGHYGNNGELQDIDSISEDVLREFQRQWGMRQNE
jgi:hypothetical protein